MITQLFHAANKIFTWAEDNSATEETQVSNGQEDKSALCSQDIDTVDRPPQLGAKVTSRICTRAFSQCPEKTLTKAPFIIQNLLRHYAEIGLLADS